MREVGEKEREKPAETSDSREREQKLPWQDVNQINLAANAHLPAVSQRYRGTNLSLGEMLPSWYFHPHLDLN